MNFIACFPSDRETCVLYCTLLKTYGRVCVCVCLRIFVVDRHLLRMILHAKLFSCFFITETEKGIQIRTMDKLNGEIACRVSPRKGYVHEKRKIRRECASKMPIRQYYCTIT